MAKPPHVTLVQPGRQATPQPAPPAPFPWRTYAGPALSAVVIALLLLIDSFIYAIPNPAPIYLLAVVVAAFIGGTVPGLISAAITFGGAALFFSEPGQLFTYQPDNVVRLGMLLVASPAIAMIVGTLRTSEEQTRQQAQSVQHELTSLRAALDQVDFGIILLDGEMRAQFINRAFRRMWNYPDAKADTKPAFVGVAYHMRDSKAVAVSDKELSAYITERITAVRSGDPTPKDLRLANGHVVRSICTVLPGGGRMLTYSDVTDLVRATEQMQEFATTDGLTGLSNRRQFFTLGHAEWSRALRYGRSLAMFVLDIDALKDINARFGHTVGDQVIMQVAYFCCENTRASDIVARIGGGEFALLLPESTIEASHIAAERLRQAVESYPLRIDDVEVPITISIGVAELDPKMRGIADLLKRADLALYRAKQRGRNRTELAAA